MPKQSKDILVPFLCITFACLIGIALADLFSQWLNASTKSRPHARVFPQPALKPAPNWSPVELRVSVHRDTAKGWRTGQRVFYVGLEWQVSQVIEVEGKERWEVVLVRFQEG